MNLGERVECGRLTPTHIGLTDKRVQSILTHAIDASQITVNGSPLAYSDLANLPTVDDTVTADSTHLVTSGAVQSAISSALVPTAPISSPSFTGTVTAPVVHATTIQLNGSDVASSIASKQTTLTGTTDVPGLDTKLNGKQDVIPD